MTLASRIDHTLLRADATTAEVERLCEEAIEWGFAGVCVNTGHMERVAARLAGTGILPVAVAGFPLGAGSTAARSFEAAWAVQHGAQEVDIVIAVGLLVAGDHGGVLADLREVVKASHPWPVKAILETCLLDRAQKLAACAIAEEAGARFVKTSTGFAAGGATVEDVALLREAVGDRLEVKASGGIRTAADALRMVEAGADRIGASASVAIVREALR